MAHMKPFGIRAEQRYYEQNYYGGYCNKVRELNLEPIPYVEFQDRLNEVLKLNLPRKEQMKNLIEITKKY